MRALRHLVLLILALAAAGGVVLAQRGGRGSAPAPPVPELNLPPNPRLDALKLELIAASTRAASSRSRWWT